MGRSVGRSFGPSVCLSFRCFEPLCQCIMNEWESIRLGSANNGIRSSNS